MKIEHKTVAFDVKAVDEGSGYVELYAAVFGNVDRTKELIEPGAFKALDEFSRDGWLAVNHEWKALGVATIDEATQDEKGLRIKAHFHSTPEAQAVRTVVKERRERGKSVKASIGYRVLQDSQEKRDDGPVRVLKAIELYEASIVNLPANPQAGVTGIKSTYDDLDEAYVALKAGRTVSRRNRERLAAVRQRLAEAATELQGLLDETDPEARGPFDVPAIPDVPKSAPRDGRTDATHLHLQLLSHCARFDPRF